MQSEEIRHTIHRMLGRLSSTDAKRIFEEIDALGANAGERGQIVRLAVIEYLNRNRQQLERRLFITCLEPFIATHPGLIAQEGTLPGLIHRMDLSGLWQALSTLVFPELVIEASQLLVELRQRQPFDRLLDASAAQDMRKRMRAIAITGLNDILAKKSKLKEFLDIANRGRDLTIAEHLGALPHGLLDRSFVVLVRDLLQADEMLASFVEQARRMVEQTPDDLRCGTELAAIFARAKDRMASERQPANLVFLIPITILHATRRYRTLMQFIRRQSRSEPLTPLYEALHSHLRQMATTLGEGLIFALGLNRGCKGPLDLWEDDQRQIEQELDGFAQLLALYDELGLLHEAKLGGSARRVLSQMTATIREAVLGPVLERVSVAAAAASAPSEDHDTVVWVLRLLWKCRDTLEERGGTSIELNAKRNNLAPELERAFGDATRVAPKTTAQSRLDHICRIHGLMAAMDSDAAEFMSTSNTGLIQTATERLLIKNPLRDDERYLLTAFVGLAQSELARIRHWKDAGFARMVEAATEHGISFSVSAPDSGTANPAKTAQHPPTCR